MLIDNNNFAWKFIRWHCIIAFAKNQYPSIHAQWTDRVHLWFSSVEMAIEKVFGEWKSAHAHFLV